MYALFGVEEITSIHVYSIGSWDTLPTEGVFTKIIIILPGMFVSTYVYTHVGI